MNIKPPSTFKEQVELLQKRGCIIGDKNFAEMCLKQVSYYHLSAYFLPFKINFTDYKAGTTFNTVFRIYEFDRKLRAFLFSVIEEIEILLRSQISYVHAHKYGSEGYLNEQNFNKQHNHEKLLEIKENVIKSNQKQLFVQHHIDNYNSHFPLWVMFEMFTLGELSKFYADLLPCDAKKIAFEIFGTTYKNVISWLRCLTDLRNCCAHYSRLYYRLFSQVPASPLNFPYRLGRTVFDYMLVLKFLYFEPVKWNKIIVETGLRPLLEEYADAVVISNIGFPEDWESILTSSKPKLGKHKKFIN